MSPSERDTWSFILVAAGSGSRMGGRASHSLPKQFRTLGGRSLWAWSAKIAESMCLDGYIDELVIVFPQFFIDSFDPSDKLGLECNVKFVAGGASRAESVKLGLAAATSTFVLVHDAARPFLAEETCLDLIELVKTSGGDRGAVPLLPSVDSLKSLDDGSISAVDRSRIFRTQTPQAFPRTALMEAMESYEGDPTDEASVWLSASLPLEHTSGDAANFKITTEFDWQMAASLVGGMREVRTGFGYDTHELVPGRGLVLGGVHVASPLGLLGHSDADIICHAISDALLGAAGAGDIGTLFPATDEKYRGADSSLLLEQVLALIGGKGWRVNWIDVVLVAQLPRLGEKVTKISENLKKLFTRSGQEAKLSLKVKSGEYIGSIGRAEGMACHAVATVERFGAI